MKVRQRRAGTLQGKDIRGYSTPHIRCYSLIESLPPETTEITKEMLERFADAENALQSFCDKVVEKAATAGAVTERELRSWFEEHLITPAGTRGIVFQDQNHTGGIPNDVVESLADQHLIRPEFRSGSRWYELAHDGFVRPIVRSNLAWGKKEKASEISDKEIARWERSITPLSKFWVYLPEFLGREESPNVNTFVEVMAHNLSKKQTEYLYIVETEENLRKLRQLVTELDKHPDCATLNVREKIKVLLLRGRGDNGVAEAVTGLLHVGNCWIANPNTSDPQGYEVAWDEAGKEPIGGRIIPEPKMKRIIESISKIVKAHTPANFVGVAEANVSSLINSSPFIQVLKPQAAGKANLRSA